MIHYHTTSSAARVIGKTKLFVYRCVMEGKLEPDATAGDRGEEGVYLFLPETIDAFKDRLTRSGALR